MVEAVHIRVALRPLIIRGALLGLVFFSALPLFFVPLERGLVRECALWGRAQLVLCAPDSLRSHGGAAIRSA